MTEEIPPSLIRPTPKATTATKCKSKWDNAKDLTLLGEVILARPFQHKTKTPGRAKAWSDIANALQARGQHATQRSVRDRVKDLMEKVKKNNNREKAASGIEVTETEDEKKIREIIEDLLQEELDIEATSKVRKDEEKKKEAGAEMRQRALETFAETQKRQNEDPCHNKRRRSGNDTMDFLLRKMERDTEMKQEEMEWKREQKERRRREELERERRSEELHHQILQQQQQLQQQMIIQQQQQQQNQQQNQQFQLMMMSFMKDLEKKD